MRWTDEEHAAYLKRQGKALPSLVGTTVSVLFPDERSFLTWIVEEARDNGWLTYHTYDSRKSAAGFPDLVLVKAGVMIAAELKCEDVKTMPLAQTRWLAELSCVPGVRAVLWQPADCESIIRQLEGAT